MALNLSLLDSDDDHPFRPMGLAAAITTFNHVTVVAPPGTGKTTTLVQAAEAILEGTVLRSLSRSGNGPHKPRRSFPRSWNPRQMRQRLTSLVVV